MFEKNGLFVFFIRSDEHLKKTGIIKKLKNHKICYVCLSDTVSSATKTLKKSGIDAKSLCFIDTLSSHYSSQKSTDRCVYISSPSAIDEISGAILMMKEKCDAFVFDDISCLLRYHEPSSVLRFTNSIKTGTPGKIVYMVSRDAVSEAIDEFIDDLVMFADETNDLTAMRKEEKFAPDTGKISHDSGAGWPYGSSGFDTPELLHD
jgi:hypothetical protein